MYGAIWRYIVFVFIMSYYYHTGAYGEVYCLRRYVSVNSSNRVRKCTLLQYIIVQRCSATVMSSGHDDAETWPCFTVHCTHTHTRILIYINIYIYNMHNMISAASRAR